MAAVFALILLLLIPLGMINSVLRDRLGRRNEAVSEITSVWGREQDIIGPVLIIPYRYTYKSWREQPSLGGKIEKVEVMETATAHACFLPARLDISGQIRPSTLLRGIYEAVVYSGKLSLSGHFARPDFESLRISDQNILWEDAVVTLAIPDLRGVKETILESEHAFQNSSNALSKISNSFSGWTTSTKHRIEIYANWHPFF